MSTGAHILLLEALDGSTQKLATRILAFGTEPVLVSDVNEALEMLAAHRVPIAAVMIPTDVPSGQLKKDIKALRRAGPASGLMFVSVGKAPTDGERKSLRSAGMQLALWDPYDDGTLRFQLNRALGGDRDHHGRTSKRAPTYLLARIFVGGREKDAVVYSLSEGGAFLETPRASMDGAEVEIELRLPGSHIRVQGFVIFSNVTGNLQRPNLPMGMGVRFENISSEDANAIGNYVIDRLTALNV